MPATQPSFLSFALQHGADLETIRKALCRDSAVPSRPVAACLDIIVGEGRGQ